MHTFYCGGNKITVIDITGCTKIRDFSCDNTDITEINVSAAAGLESFVCNDCLIKTLDVSANKSLAKLHAQGNPLTSLVMAQGQTIPDLKLDNHGVISYK
jgi:Leucine-rich repeat (LRR) protein